MKLTSHMPSQEVMSYYKLLLKGIKVEPGQSDRDYQILLNDNRKRKGRAQEPLPIEDVPQHGGDAVTLALPEPPDTGARGSRGGGPKRHRGAGGAKPDELPTPVPIGGGPATPPPPKSPPPVEPGEGAGEDEVILADPDPGDKFTTERYPFELALDGASIICQKYYNRAKDASFVNWILKCPRHKDCVKKKHVTTQSTSRHGALGPVAASYLRY